MVLGPGSWSWLASDSFLVEEAKNSICIFPAPTKLIDHPLRVVSTVWSQGYRRVETIRAFKSNENIQ